MIVVDASALVYALTETGPAALDVRQLFGRETCHSPHLIDAEVGQALRRMAMRGVVLDKVAEVTLTNAAQVIDERHEAHGQLSSIAWSLRHRVSFYDGLYVALAAVLDAPLVTADARLTRTPLPCRFQLVSA